ncbi:MAG: RecX family transcriptional regulator [Erysipelotrichales bacterium]|nr:RecX family transcriptional regulator [Erysipelotrichales bacterium]
MEYHDNNYNHCLKTVVENKEFEVFKIKKQSGKVFVVFTDGSKEYLIEAGPEIFEAYAYQVGIILSANEFNAFCREVDYHEGLTKLFSYLRKNRTAAEIEYFLHFSLKTAQYDRFHRILEEMNLFNDEKYCENYFFSRYSWFDSPQAIIEKLIYKCNIDSDLAKKVVWELYTEELMDKAITTLIVRSAKSWRSSINHFILKVQDTLTNKGFEDSKIKVLLIEQEERIKELIDEKKNLFRDFEKIMDKYYFLEDEEAKREGFLQALTKKGYNENDIIRQIKEY